MGGVKDYEGVTIDCTHGGCSGTVAVASARSAEITPEGWLFRGILCDGCGRIYAIHEDAIRERAQR